MNGLSFMFVILWVDVTVNTLEHILFCVKEKGHFIALLPKPQQ